MEYKDQLNRTIQLNETPKRIVSLVPSQTELLVDIGLEDSIVGITKFCVHPSHLRKFKTVVGGTKQIHVEKIKALKPDIILCNKEENTKPIIEALQPFAPIHISDVNNLEDAFELIKMYGKIFNVEEKANSIVSIIQKERSHFQNYLKSKPTLKTAYFIWKKPWMVVASNTFINAMLTEGGFKNVFTKKERYPSIDLDDSNLKEAEVIFLSSEPYPFKTKHVSKFEEKFPAIKVKIVDGEMFSWYGSRLQKSFIYFKKVHNKL